MNLQTAIKFNGKVIVGGVGQPHIDLIMQQNLKPDGVVHGFSVNGRFLSREQASAWLKIFEPQKAKKLETVKELHSHHVKKEFTLGPINNKTVIVIDHGLYTYVAEHLAKCFGKVQYWNPRAEPYAFSPQAKIGQGLDGVEWIDSLWNNIDAADCLFFPDIYEGKMQAFLRGKGYKICGAGNAEKLELDKAYFKECLSDMGLPSAYTYQAEGLDDAYDFLKDKQPGGYFIKNAEKYRGDWETVKLHNRYQLKNYLDIKRAELGTRAKTIKLLCERRIESTCEVGRDGFLLNGVMAPNSLVGYEIKDEAYCGKLFEDMPEILTATDELLIAECKDYAGPYSEELRITESGRVYPIDLTCRCPSPPTGAELAIYGKSYAEAIWALANGQMPQLRGEGGKYCAEVILASDWNNENELHVGLPKDCEGIMLKNAIKRNGQYYCVPNGNGGIFGSAIGAGGTLKEAINKCLDAIKELDVYGLDWRHDVFDEAEQTIKNGEKFGIKF